MIGLVRLKLVFLIVGLVVFCRLKIGWEVSPLARVKKNDSFRFADSHIGLARLNPNPLLFSPSYLGSPHTGLIVISHTFDLECGLSEPSAFAISRDVGHQN